MRALIDTVVVDAMQKREPFSYDSQNAVLICCGGECDGFITAKALTDIYYLTHQKLHDIAKTRDVIARLCYIFDVLDTVASDVRNAILSDVSGIIRIRRFLLFLRRSSLDEAGGICDWV